MAWIEKRGKSFRLVLRDHGRKLIRYPLAVRDADEAEEMRLRFERRLKLHRAGDLHVPDGVELIPFLLDGKPPVESTPVTPVLTLAQLFRHYQDELSAEAKERQTRITEKHHLASLCRLLGANTPASSINTAMLQRYIDRRAKERGRRGRGISQATIKKELATLRMIANWAIHREIIARPIRLKGLIYIKARSKHPFQTMEQVQRQVERGGLTEIEEHELWDSVFLTTKQIDQLLEDVRQIQTSPYVYPMFVFAAMTGARRSEMMRSRIDDFDFEGGFLRIREKKRDTSKDITFRTVPIAPMLHRVMREWFRHHPGGQHTLTADSPSPLGKQTAAWAFRGTVVGTRWEKLRGWHMFRHSFCSNCAAAGVDQRLINEWVGHQTEEMVRRYRHLFPDQQREAIATVFSEARFG